MQFYISWETGEKDKQISRTIPAYSQEGQKETVAETKATHPLRKLDNPLKSEPLARQGDHTCQHILRNLFWMA